MNVGNRIKKVRSMLNRSQQQLADELGITKQAISNIETGKSAPGLNLLNKLLFDYKINLNYIIGGLGNILIDENDKIGKSLKDSILKEVEKMLEDRGVN